MNTPDCGRKQSLLSDQNGAMVVVGTFMAVFLAAGLFFIVGTGEAIVYRERLQDASDAMAFSAAGIHARGMNIIVLINLIMAALVAILIFMRLLRYINIGLIAATTIACPFTGFVCPYPGIGKTIDTFLSKAIKVYDNALHKAILPALNIAQIGVAVGTPWVATVKTAPAVRKKFEPLVTSGTAISPSLMPFSGGGMKDLDVKKMLSGKLGLPVQQDTYDTLCKKGGEQVADIFKKLVPGIVGRVIAWGAGGIINAFPSAFCGGSDSSLADMSNIGDHFKDLKGGPGGTAQKMCEARRDKEKKDYEKKHKNDNPPAPAWDDSMFSEGSLASCKQKQQQELDNQLNTDTSTQSNTDWSTPKKVYDGAKHGGGHFQVWALAMGQEDWPRRTDPAIEMATWSKGGSVKDPMLSRYKIAQAEFYFDKPGAWSDNEDVAMWEMRWRARLRRTRVDVPEILGGMAGPLMDKLMGKINNKVFGVLNDKKAGPLVLLGADALGNLVKKYGEDLLKGLGGKGDGAINAGVQKLLATPEIIH